MILMQGATDGQKARQTTGKVGKLIGVGQWTRRRLSKKKKTTGLKNKHDFPLIDSMCTLSGWTECVCLVYIKPNP